MTKHDIIKCLVLFKNVYWVISACILVSFDVSLASNFIGPIGCVSLNNQPYHAGSTLFNINSNQSLFYLVPVSFNNCSFMCSI